MILLQDKKVRVIFKNGMSVDGVVQEWSNDLSILKNEENDNLLMIYETSSNVMMVQVIVEETKEERQKRRIKAIDALNAMDDELSAYQEPDRRSSNYMYNNPTKSHPPDPDPKELELEYYEPDPTLRAQKLAELRKLQLQEHKKQLGRHIKAWKAGGVAQTKYSYPSKI